MARSLHAAELQAVGVSLVTRHQVVVVENPYPEDCGVDAEAKEEDAAEAHHLVETGDKADKRAEARPYKFIRKFPLHKFLSRQVAQYCVCVYFHLLTSMQT